MEIIPVDLNGLGTPDLQLAYELVREAGAAGYTLYVDSNVMKSSRTPLREFNFSDKTPPGGSLDLYQLRLELTAIRAARRLGELGILDIGNEEATEDEEVVIDRAPLSFVKAEVKTSELAD